MEVFTHRGYPWGISWALIRALTMRAHLRHILHALFVRFLTSFPIRPLCVTLLAESPSIFPIFLGRSKETLQAGYLCVLSHVPLCVLVYVPLCIPDHDCAPCLLYLSFTSINAAQCAFPISFPVAFTCIFLNASRILLPRAFPFSFCFVVYRDLLFGPLHFTFSFTLFLLSRRV